MVNDDQAKTIKLLHGLFWQSIFSLTSVVGFLIVLFRFLNAQTSFEVYKYGAMEAFLSATIYLAFRYWLPVKSKKEGDS